MKLDVDLDVDLDLNNYNLQDILNLFHLKINFTKDDLKNAKKIVLMTHPDKSKLNPKFFIFYSKAFKYLIQINEMQNKIQKQQTTEYFEPDTTNNDIIDKYINENNLKGNKFTEWFNKEFEKIKLNKEDDEDGYGNWFKEENEDIICKTFDQLEEIKKKQQQQQNSLIIYDELESFSLISPTLSGTILFDDKNIKYYGSSTGKYEDLKYAHTNSVIAVTEQDILHANIGRSNNINQLQINRSQDFIKSTKKEILALKEKEFFKKKEREDGLYLNYAYNLIKETEEIQKRQEKFMAQLKTLT